VAELQYRKRWRLTHPSSLLCAVMINYILLVSRQGMFYTFCGG
jgi:hypothetical protein